MNDYLVTETQETHKDDNTGAISYRVILECVDKTNPGIVLCKGEAEGDEMKETIIAARTAWVHSLAKMWNVAE